MKDKKKNNRLWSGDFKLKVVLDIIENELSYSQAARKYDMYLSSGSLNDTLPARWVYQYRLYGKERFFHIIPPAYILVYTKYRFLVSVQYFRHQR